MNVCKPFLSELFYTDYFEVQSEEWNNYTVRAIISSQTDS